MEEKEKGGFLKAINNIIKKKAESCTGVPAGSQLFLFTLFCLCAPGIAKGYKGYRVRTVHFAE